MSSLPVFCGELLDLNVALGRPACWRLKRALGVVFLFSILAEVPDPFYRGHRSLKLCPEQNHHLEVRGEGDDLRERHPCETRRYCVAQRDSNADDDRRKAGDRQIQDEAKPFLNDVHKIERFL